MYTKRSVIKSCEFVVAVILIPGALLIFTSFVHGGIERTASMRRAFMELGRFSDCGVNATPVAEYRAYTQNHCGVRCLEDTRCVSYEYVPENKTCFLHEVSAIENLIEKFGYTYADSTDPVQVGEVHPCEQSYCSEGNVCIEECAPNGFTCECPEGYFGRFCDKLIPVDGGFTPWGNWSDCNDVCKTTRYRNCTNPLRVSTGADCVGPNTDVMMCSTEDCHVYPYAGCFHQSEYSNGKLLNVLISENMTIELCVEKCSLLGYKYAAIQYDVCRCNRHGPVPVTFDELQCTTACPGNENQTCGDDTNYFSVYSTGTFYQGCFTGNLSDALVIIAPEEEYYVIHSTVAYTTMGASTQPPTTMQTTGDLTTYETIDGTTTSDTTKVAHSVTSGTNLSESDNTTQSNGTDGYTDPHSTSVTTDVPTTTFTTHFTTDVTTEGQTTVEPPTGAPDLTLTVAGCVRECEVLGYLYAFLFNGSYCLCHTTVQHLNRSSSGCNAPCPGGDGLVCGGDSTISVYQINPNEIAHWTAWYNNHFPFQDGGDYEDPAEIHANEPWICDYPQDVQCREFATGQTNEEIGDVFETPCSVDHGFNCTAAMQAYTINVTFDVINYRIVDIDTEVNITELNCSFSIENTTTTQSPFSVETNMTSTTQFQSESTTEKPTTVEPTKAGYHSTTEMVSNVTSQGSNSTNVNGTDEILSMQCHNVSVTKIQTIHVNESYITIGWRIDTILKNCEDYKLRFFCPQVRDRLIGCYFEGSLNEFIANTTMEVNFGNCTSLCRESGYRYAAIQKPNEECACANTYNNNPTFSAACFSKCGDNDYPCGGMSSQSIYYTDCDMPFNIDNTTMSGTPMHRNLGHDVYDAWFGGFNDNTTVYRGNFTNYGKQLSFELNIDLGRVRPVNKLVTSGIFVFGADVITGTTSFRLAYKVFEYDEPVFVLESATAAKAFEVDDLSSVTEHSLGNIIEMRYLQIFVDSYELFPGILLDVHGCRG